MTNIKWMGIYPLGYVLLIAGALTLAQFDGMDGHDSAGVLFSGGPPPGRFAFQIATTSGLNRRGDARALTLDKPPAWSKELPGFLA